VRDLPIRLRIRRLHSRIESRFDALRQRLKAVRDVLQLSVDEESRRGPHPAQRELNRAYFPGGLKVSMEPGDKAVYIGTVQYRNEFFEVTKGGAVRAIFGVAPFNLAAWNAWSQG